MKDEMKKTISDYIDHLNKLSGKMLSPEDQAIVDNINYEVRQILSVNSEEDYQKLQNFNGRLLTIESRY